MGLNMQAKELNRMTSVNHLPRNGKDTDPENRCETNLVARGPEVSSKPG